MPVADFVVVVMIRGLPLIQPNCFVILSSLFFVQVFGTFGLVMLFHDSVC